MFKKTLIAISLLSLSATAAASNWVVGGGYSALSDKIDGDSISLGMVYGSIGYQLELENKDIVITPELRLGVGAGDDTVYGVQVEVDTFTAFSARFQYNYKNGLYLFATPSFAKVGFKATYYGSSNTVNSDWELGYGAGAGYKINDKFSLEAAYDNYDCTGVLSFGAKLAF